MAQFPLSSPAEPGDMSTIPIDKLSGIVLAAYRESFIQDVAEGRAKPLLFPFGLLAPVIVPVLWLAIPHTQRPWVYRTRWLVMAFILASNFDQLLHVSSTNMFWSHVAGLMATWGTMLSMNLLIWKRPQFEAARCVKVAKIQRTKVETDSVLGEDVSHIKQEETENRTAVGNGLRQRTTAATAVATAAEGNDVVSAGKHQDDSEFDYTWQTFPETASYWERLGWAFDLYISFRGAGWNWAVSPIPRPVIPREIRQGDLVEIHSMPIRSISGFERHPTVAEFTRNRLTVVTAMYVILDFVAVFMKMDPYFILGPYHHSYTLPPHLEHMSPWLLYTYRHLLSLVAIYSVITAAMGASDLVQYHTLAYMFPSRAIVWTFASTFGSFTHVLDRGLAGVWSGWWHQTFRMQFAAPSVYLVKQGYLKQGTPFATIILLTISFLQSGLLHVSGSLTAIPSTKPWHSLAFFMLQAVGIVVQHVSSLALRPFTRSLPRALTRWSAMLFAIAWGFFTVYLFFDEIAASGLWLLEPVPVSFVRILGFGFPNERWWRWDREMFIKWSSGDRWWQSGFVL